MDPNAAQQNPQPVAPETPQTAPATSGVSSSAAAPQPVVSTPTPLPDPAQSSPATLPTTPPAPTPAFQPPVPPAPVAQQGVTPSDKPKARPFKKIIFALIALIILAGLGGGGYYVLSQKQVVTKQVIAPPTPTTKPIPTTDPTTNWKVYTNTKFNFSIKYPTDWTTLNTTPNNVALHAVGDSGILDAVVPPGYPNDPSGVLYGGVFFQIFKVDPNQSLSDWATQHGYQGNSQDKISYQPIKVNGYDAIQANFVQSEAGSKAKQTSPLPAGYKARYVYIKNNDIVLGLQASGNIKNPDEDLKLFDQMLSTFTFTNIQTYTGNGFSFQYPTSWTLKKNAQTPFDVYVYDPTSGSPTGNGGGILYKDSLDVTPITTTQTTDVYINTLQSKQIAALASDFQKKTITLNGQSVEVYHQGGEGAVGWYVPFSNGNMIVDFGPLSTDPSVDSPEVRIITSFTFK